MKRWLVRILVVLATVYSLIAGYGQFRDWVQEQQSDEPLSRYCYGDLAVKIPCEQKARGEKR